MKKPTIKSLLEKIEALEAKVEALEKSPRETHNHFYTNYQPLMPSWTPQPNTPLWWGVGSAADGDPTITKYNVTSGTTENDQ